MTPPLIWLIYLTLFPNFQITLGLMKSNGCVALLDVLNIDLQYTIYVNELILPLFSLFIVYRKQMTWKSIVKTMLTLNVLCISESYIEIKIKLNFYFHTSLWCLKRLYEENLLRHQKEVWKKKLT